ncbi:MAG: MATE family efflux transporter [Lachnospiraceae bacterium]|nr:MATE family efflux transporter [Lachnospiraceae bacterium]
MKHFTQNLTEGNETRLILKFTLPLLAGNLFQQLYNLADSAIVGRVLGPSALEAVGTTGSITFLFYTLCIGLATGAGILVSQRFGAGEMKKVKELIVNSALITLIFGIVLSLISVAAAPFLLEHVLHAPKSVLSQAVSYMRIACAGTVMVAAYNWINAVMRSLGDSKTPLYFLIVASIVNIVLDLLFVIVFKMGVQGAALATVLAQGISAVGSIVFAKLKNPCFDFSEGGIKIKGRLMRLIVKTGTPIALQNAMVSVSMVYLQRTANRFDDNVVAAYTVTMRVEQLIQQPFSSLGIALSAFTGQNMGAGKEDRVVSGYKKSLVIMTAFALVMLGVFGLFSGSIVGIFVRDTGVIAIGKRALAVSACFYIFLGLIHTTRGLLNGAGDVNYALYNGFLEVVGRIGFAIILVNIPAVGYLAVWGTSCLTWLLTGVMSVVRYKGGKWRRLCQTA